MGVFLSKPSVTKFSQDGEDNEIGFGVSSMQGWRKGMEDAHLALLGVAPGSATKFNEEQEGKSGGDDGEEGERSGNSGGGDKIRVFGVFDGHGGKEVALFVQKHMVEELVKLQEYREGNYPAALIRVFHRMDELLEGAATELLRSRGILREEGAKIEAAPAKEEPASGGSGESNGVGVREADAAAAAVAAAPSAAPSAPSAPAVAGGGNGGAQVGENGGAKSGQQAEGREGGETGPGGRAGRAEVGDSSERYMEFLNELSEFRSRKNPSDLEEEEEAASKARGSIPGSSANYDNDEDEDDGDDDHGVAGRGAARTGRGGSPKKRNGGGGGSGHDEVLELGSGTGGGRKIKMTDALELFHRILDIKKVQQRSATAAAAAAEVNPSSLGGGDDADASPCPPPPSLPAAGSNSSRSCSSNSSSSSCSSEDGDDGPKGSADGCGGDQGVAPSAGGGVGVLTTPARPPARRRDTPSTGSEEGAGSGWPAKMGVEVVADDEGEDTFGDSDESEEDDVVITPVAGKPNAIYTGGPTFGGGAAEGAAARPRLGLGARLTSIVHGHGGNAPTCNLPDHPIQAGCTSVVCLMAGNLLHVANAGDSRAVLCRGGAAVALSHDHKPMSVIERTRIQKAGGFVNAAGRVNGNLNLSRSIGDLKYKANSSLPAAEQMITAEPDLKTVAITPEDQFMILACDGVWDCMSSQECVDFVGARIGKMPLSKVCEEVMDACLSEDPRKTTGIGGDNMTCIVVLLDKAFTAPDSTSPPSEVAEKVGPEEEAKVSASVPQPE